MNDPDRNGMRSTDSTFSLFTVDWFAVLSFFFFFSFLFRATPVTCGSSLARGQIRADTVSMRIQAPSLASPSGLRFWCYHKLWCRSQMRLGSGVAVIVA